MERTNSLLRPLRTGPEWIQSLTTQQETVEKSSSGGKQCSVCTIPITNQLERRTCKVCNATACRLCTALVHIINHRRRKYVCFRCLKTATSTIVDREGGASNGTEAQDAFASEYNVVQRLSERAADEENGEGTVFENLWSAWSSWMEMEPESDGESDLDTTMPSRHVRNSSKKLFAAQAESTVEEGMFDGFEMARVMQEAVNPSSKAINAVLFVEASAFVVKFTAVLGKAFEYGVVDLNHKIDILQNRTDEYAMAHGVDRASVSLQDLVEYDIQRGVTHSGKKAAPASRNILRLLWFIDFLRHLLHSLASDYDADLKQVCRIVYESVLAKYHSFVMKRVVRAGFTFVPDRSRFRDRAGLVGMKPEEEADTLNQWAAPADEISMLLWEFMESKGLKKLP